MQHSRTYGEWTYSSIMRVKKDLLMTLEYMMENKSMDNGKAFSSSQVETVEKAIKSIHCIMHIKKDMAEWEESNGAQAKSLPKTMHSMHNQLS